MNQTYSFPAGAGGSVPKPIMVIGSTCVDIIITLDHLPRTQEDLHPTGNTLALGGCAYNVASAVRLFQAPVSLISPVGTGFYGEFVSKELEKRGFPITVRVPDQENGCCYCLVEASGERTFLSYHGAEYTFHKSWMETFDQTPYEMVYVCGLEIEEPTGGELIEYLESHPERQLFYAPGPRGIRIEKEKNDRIFALHPVLHINELEARELSGIPKGPGRPETPSAPETAAVPIESELIRAAEILQAKTENTVIITLGERGTYCLEKGGLAYLVPAVPVQVADTIGAGDSHIGAVMASLSLGYPMKEAIQIANRVASAVVGVTGASLTEAEFRSIFCNVS